MKKCKFQPERLVREGVLKVPEYRFDEVTSREYLKLNFNENYLVEREFIKRLVSEALEEVDVREYPPAKGALIAKAVSEFFGLEESWVFPGNGLDGVMDVLFRTYLKKGRRVVIIEPTFSLYSYYTILYNGEVSEVLLNPDFTLNENKILESVDERTSIVLICSPNNPTGNQFSKGSVQSILESVDALVVVDEAYVNFADYTLIDLVKDYENLAVLRSLSKVCAIAGVRSGYLIANPWIVGYMKKATPPFHVNLLTQKITVKALENWRYFEEKAETIIEERRRLSEALKRIEGVEPYSSKTNFLLCKVTKRGLPVSELKERLKEKRVLVRDVSDRPLLDNCFRVTVGTREMNETFISSLKEVLEETP